MTKTQRPLSPHLQVYRPQLTSVLSISHRAAGVFLSLGALLLCWWIVSIAAGQNTFDLFMHHAATWYGRLLGGVLLASLYFHLCNGVRHLFWDMGLGLEIRSTYRSGYAVIVCTILLTAATLILWTRP